MRSVKKLQQLATEMVGDGGKPNLYFVSEDGVICLIARDFELAYDCWKEISIGRNTETALEDRQHGVLASIEPDAEGDKRLVAVDSTHMFKLS